MSLPARAVPHAFPEPSPVERHVEAQFTRLRGALALGEMLADPRARNPDTARAHALSFVEVLVGFAIGNAIAHVIPGPRDRLGAIAGATRLPRTPVVPRFLRDPERRPIVELVFSQLHFRLCLAEPQVRAALAGGRLTDVAPAVLAFEDQLALGWRFLCAVIEGKPDPAIDDAPRWRRARLLWPTWSQRARGVMTCSSPSCSSPSCSSPSCSSPSCSSPSCSSPTPIPTQYILRIG
jgi:hypothetical protein